MVAVFDKIYTHPLLSPRAFLRSALFTFVVTVAYSYEYFNTSRLLRGLWVLVYDGTKTNSIDETIFKLDVAFYLATFFTNAITDYGSLFLIRRCLIRLGGTPTFALLLGALIGFDVVGLGAILRTLVLGMYASSAEILPNWWLFSKASLLVAAPALVVFAWLPLFALGILAIRALTPLSWLVKQVEWALRSCEGHPLKAIGYVAAAIVFVITAGWRLILGA